MSKLAVRKFARKLFLVDAVQVTEDNMKDACTWCGGTVDVDTQDRLHIKVDVKKPLYERQTTAYVGDWILRAGRGFRVYTRSSFENTFDAYVNEDVVSVDASQMFLTDNLVMSPTAVGEAMRKAQQQVKKLNEPIATGEMSIPPFTD